LPGARLPEITRDYQNCLKTNFAVAPGKPDNYLFQRASATGFPGGGQKFTFSLPLPHQIQNSGCFTGDSHNRRSTPVKAAHFPVA
jgi:hypothetical protein